jgi:hypothetical protein
MSLRLKTVLISMSLLALTGLTSACSSSTSSQEMVPATVNYQVSDAVLTEYFQAICEGSTAKLAIGGTYDAAAQSCTDSLGTVSTKQAFVDSFVGSTPGQMVQSIQMMVAQVGTPVTDCPTSQDFNTIVDLTITDSCVENALTAMTQFMKS